ncbi:hypothetical protein TNCV_1694201 [Trichonephila clavipes]|nr:hypothetical protein TNCV_1694201 [Trichonephila clavipes]
MLFELGRTRQKNLNPPRAHIRNEYQQSLGTIDSSTSQFRRPCIHLQTFGYEIQQLGLDTVVQSPVIMNC